MLSHFGNLGELGYWYYITEFCKTIALSARKSDSIERLRSQSIKLANCLKSMRKWFEKCTARSTDTAINASAQRGHCRFRAVHMSLLIRRSDEMTKVQRTVTAWFDAVSRLSVAFFGSFPGTLKGSPRLSSWKHGWNRNYPCSRDRGISERRSCSCGWAFVWTPIRPYL